MSIVTTNGKGGKCPKCHAKKGKRPCPALGGQICSKCCGEHRLRTIDCPPDCTYLEGVDYQAKKRVQTANTRGRAFIESLGAVFDNQADLRFAVTAHADVYFFAGRHGPVENEAIASAFEAVKGMLSPVYVPAGERDPLAMYLRGRIENSARYDISPLFRSADRVRVLGSLVKYVRRQDGGAGSTAYFDSLAHYFESMDLGEDFAFSEEDEQALGGEPMRRDSEGFRRSDSGLILPG